MEKIITLLLKQIFYHRILIMIWRIIMLVILWVCFILYQQQVIHGFYLLFTALPLLWYTCYFIFVSLRWLTFIPLTTILLAVAPFTNHRLLWILTMAGTLITSYLIYYFSQALQLDDYFERTHKRSIAMIRKWLVQYELPVIIMRSMLPFTPTDLICYIAGTLNINIRKMLLGVFIGEWLVCIAYIWWIQSIFSYFIS